MHGAADAQLREGGQRLERIGGRLEPQDAPQEGLPGTDRQALEVRDERRLAQRVDPGFLRGPDAAEPGAELERGAAVVCASRYVRGGAQHGGPWLKGLLSRMAGLSLHWLAGLPTHDPTNSFKAYRRDFLRRTPIESGAGFVLALELTVKAHFAGERVEEVPAQWWDRTAGRSRFRLFAWLPLYLRWYVWAIGQRLGGRRP